MKYLLDTQAYLLLLEQDPELSPKANKAVENPKAEIFISIVSFWEMAVKINIGKLQLKASLQEIIQSSITSGGLSVLPVLIEHIIGLGSLPLHHRDPFDRLLLSQAKHEGMALISGDRAFDRYGVERIW